MPWHKDTFAGNPVIYAGDGKNSATFYGPDAEMMRDMCSAAPDLIQALEWVLKNYKRHDDSGYFDGWPEVKFANEVIGKANGIEPKKVRTCSDLEVA